MILTLSFIAFALLSFYCFYKQRETKQIILELEKQLSEKEGELQIQWIENAKLSTKLEAQTLHFQSQINLLEKSEYQLQAQISLATQKSLETAQKTLVEIAESRWSQVQENQNKNMEMREKQIQSLLDPIKTGLDKLEKERQGEQRQWSEVYGSLKEALVQQLQATHTLEKETTQLNHALKTPHMRGAWGELQLERIVELAGMTSYCDFETQKHLVSKNELQDKRLRPDMVIRLPQNRQLAIDAKAPLKAFLEAFELQDEKERAAKLHEHVTQMKGHIQRLSQKEYWSQLPGLDMVVMFIPSDTFLHHALNLDQELLEWAAQKQVLIATPSSLIALLKVCAQSWHREQVEEKVLQVLSHSKELYSRLLKLADHLQQLGKALDKASQCFNNVIGYWQSRVLLSARKVAELDPGADALPEIETLANSLRSIEPARD
jgi:DNA recombination protein RmuC